MRARQRDAVFEGRRILLAEDDVRNIFALSHVLEPLGGYLRLGQALLEQGAAVAEGWNFGPDPAGARTVGDLADLFCQTWGEGAAWQAEPNPANPHEAHLLQLNIAKAAARLDWRPKWDFETTVRRTAAGYQAMRAAADAAATRRFMEGEIAAYESAT